MQKNKDDLRKKNLAAIKQNGTNCDLNFIDVSKITDMSDLFSDEDLSQFAGDISKWNVSKVTNMWVIFKGSQFTGDLNKWKVSDGTDMEDAFMDSALEKIGKIPKWYKPKEDFLVGNMYPITPRTC